MGMRIVAYAFDGIAKVQCRKCKVEHEVAFDGTDLDSSIENAIERGMAEGGWDSLNRVCPNCYDEYEEVDEDAEMDDDFDEEDYDIDLDEDDYDGEE
jgi:hypothetical protein